MVELRVDASRAIRRLAKVRRDLPVRARAALRFLGAEWERRMKRGQFFPYRGRSYARRLQIRTGSLRRAIRFRLAGTPKEPELRMFVQGVPHARIQELGGVVRGRPWLAIPLPSTLKPSGAGVKARYKTVRRGGGWETTRGERTFVRRTKAGNLVVFAVTGTRTKRLVPLLALKRRVKLPAGRLGFFRTWREMEGRRRRTLKEVLRDALA
jgi:hypothetical protein